MTSKLETPSLSDCDEKTALLKASHCFQSRCRSSCPLTDMPASIGRKSTPVGFEPTRGDPIGLAGRRLDHSAKVSISCKYIKEYAIGEKDNSVLFVRKTNDNSKQSRSKDTEVHSCAARHFDANLELRRHDVSEWLKLSSARRGSNPRAVEV